MQHQTYTFDAQSQVPVPTAWEPSVHSQTDAVVESYIPSFCTSVRLQIIGLLMLPLFGLGLPLLLVGYRRKKHIMRLVEQIGMEKMVWIKFVSSRVATFRFEQTALQIAKAFISLIAASVLVGMILRFSVLNEIGQLANGLSPADSVSQRGKRADTSSGLHSFMGSSSKNTQ